ncbi:MAG: hypothetical protein JWQ07_4208 [Ramlibacter sp.]|nr:hypothetical protein [Ramlibacter sp.]
MKSRAIVCAIAAASLGFGSLSFAQGYNQRDNDQQRNEQRNEQRNGQQRYDQQRYDQQRYDQRGHDQRGPDQRAMGNREFRHDQARDYYGARGPEWRRGGHVPQEYRDRQYVVNDWRGHHLNAPPRGYQWVQVGGDYVLVAIATGIIAQLLLNQ